MSAGDAEPQTATSYATGGGGTVLEHRYGATLLCNLLTGDPMPELGDDATPGSVRFQASAISPVDDLVVVGRTPDGGQRRVSIGVRRAPALVASEDASARLLISYLRVVTDHWGEVQAGRWRLALVVVSPNPAVVQLGELAVIARGTAEEAAFRAEVHRPRRTNSGVRGRLGHVDALVAAAATKAGINLDEVGVGELTWRLLSALRLREVRLEGVDETDRTIAVGRLRTVTPDGAVAAANDLFAKLAELTGHYAPAAAVVTGTLLRRDLSGTPLDRSPAYAQAWRILDGLSERLRDRTGFRLTDLQADLELERADARAALAAKMTAAATGPAALVVHGEPDVGKSALTLRTAEQLAAAGAAVTTLSLRDLPGTTVELEVLLGGRLSEVLGATAVDAGRLLVIDGAESVLEGRGPLLTEVATAALRAGLGVVAVTRSDGARAVGRELSSAAVAAGVTGQQVHEHEVARLTSAETTQLAATFASLVRLGEEPRAAWLLGRPGLVDLLLRAGAAGALPGGPLSEADVFAAVWGQVVRCGEVAVPGGPAPDARERALVSLARRLLLPGGSSELPDASALPSLRSDGLLLAPGPTSAWNPGDQLASDLVRDLAVARLLITDGFDLLAEAGAPRWALRAVRLACQAILSAGPNTEERWGWLQSVFGDVAARHGRRWAEVPLEAMLTLGSPQQALTRAWPGLLAEQRAGLRTLLRLALQRYTRHGFGDVVVLGPVVALTYCGEDDLGQDDRYDRGTGEQIRELVLAWLRGLVKTNTGPLRLRQQVRDRLLETDPVPSDEFAVEAVAMLGPDLYERAEAFLRGLAEDGDGYLASAVESIGPVLALSNHQPELLIALAEGFYILRPPDDDDEYGWSSDFLDEGIRHHEKAGGGFGVPMVAWYYGPFFRLLNTRPFDALALVNRMLDHAAAARVGGRRHWGARPRRSEEPLPGLDLDLPGVGMRRCVGDDHVWSWYRGSSVGPYPCMSALLAVERFADHFVDTLGIPLANVTEVLLRDCHNLAMPGLVVGMLVRHLDRSEDLLDRWLVRPELWELEFSRTVREGHLHVQGADPPELVGRDRRRLSFRDAAAELTLRAMAAGDQRRLAALGTTGDELVRRARELLADNDGTDHMVAVEGWAAALRPQNYHARRADDGGVIVQYEHPEEVAEGLAPGLASLARGNEALRLQLTYAKSEDRVAAVETLLDDLVLARQLVEDPPICGPLHPADPIAAVAAAAVVAHAQGRASVPEDDLRWAAEVLVEVARRPWLDAMSDESSVYPMGADRSAAAGLPVLLLPPFDGVALDRAEVEKALWHCTTSLFDEVRVAFALSVAPVWAAPCEPSATSGTCRHETAWTAVQEGLRDCRLGDWDQAGRRQPDPLEGPYDQTLPTVQSERLLVYWLVAPLVAAAAAARSASCVAGAARRLLRVLFAAHRRGADHWARKGYGRYNDRQRAVVARLLVQAAVAGDAEELTEYVRVFTANARALDAFLRDLAVLFTYDEGLRSALPSVWRQVLTAALDALDAGTDLLGDHHGSDSALGGLLPTPQLDMGDTAPDATLERARQGWVAPEAIADLVARWVPIARREPRAADAVAQLAGCASPSWQATTGLLWAEELIDGDYAAVASRCWFLTDWLEAVRAAGQLDADGTARWRRLVDGLAAEGDSRAVKLQQAEE
jgi:hypothetical protein